MEGGEHAKKQQHPTEHEPLGSRLQDVEHCRPAATIEGISVRCACRGQEPQLLALSCALLRAAFKVRAARHSAQGAHLLCDQGHQDGLHFVAGTLQLLPNVTILANALPHMALVLRVEIREG
eukprot:CAMPEP_0180423560 /NCGR_PEP_ID=MMETSP1036_2-20121128/4281_1 /TAXON_ID=632150 /ORGANISM="Azadinium spinosum, Strain 3D9" /LENGTH=121 /DNA_ID=CAMNT_0022428963 /DNA_START=67 /DNA_END=432 /DNA_ORIENTATION=-